MGHGMEGGEGRAEAVLACRAGCGDERVTMPSESLVPSCHRLSGLCHHADPEIIQSLRDGHGKPIGSCFLTLTVEA